jgi:hypothetical protein
MKNKHLRSIVLIPHRDALIPINVYRQTLFAQGFTGSYSFPEVIPLMMTKKPYTLAELKEAAMFLKTMILDKQKDGKCFSQQTDIIKISPHVVLGGLSFNLSLDTFPLKHDDTALRRFLLGLTVLKSGTEELFLRFAKDVPPPSVSFRACSTANMIYTVSEDGAYSWEIGHPVWLPSDKKET